MNGRVTASLQLTWKVTVNPEMWGSFSTQYDLAKLSDPVLNKRSLNSINEGRSNESPELGMLSGG